MYCHEGARPLLAKTVACTNLSVQLALRQMHEPSLCWRLQPMVCCIAITWQVVEGFEVVKATEGCGSRNGETAFDVMIANCGQLPKGELSSTPS